MDPRDPRFLVSREEFEDVQMEVKQVHFIQVNHNERLLRLEKRQADEASIKSVWNSPFPSVLGGTPQHGPVQTPNNEEPFEDFGEQGQSLVGSLHLDADDEPIRRGAASRANSVRFDESAIQGSSWGQGTRQSGEFGPIRPGSAFGSHPMMERSLSHKSDGRHSSAGHSVHSLHSMASGRGSSLGIDGNILTRDDDDSPLDMPEPPPGFFVLGSVPSIIRCWLTNTNFVNDTVLYADLCSGSQRSTVDFSLVRELDLLGEIHRDMDGSYRVRLAVYLTEASVIQSHSRSPSPPQIPSITANFEVLGMDQPEAAAEGKKSIRIFIGSDTLRAHSADILFSQNRMHIYGNDRDKLSVPFVRPEDDGLFRHLATANVLPEKPKLNATAPEFVLGEMKSAPATPSPKDPGDEVIAPQARQTDVEAPQGPLSPPLTSQSSQPPKWTGTSAQSESGAENDRAPKDSAESEVSTRESTTTTESRPREKSSIWESWRHGGSANGADGGREGPLSGYQPPTRSNRSGMKVLKPVKSGNSSSARTGASYEPAPSARSSGEHRRKTLGGGAGTNENGSASAGGGGGGGGGGTGGSNGSSGSGNTRWDPKRSVSSTTGANGSAAGGDGRESKSQSSTRDARNAPANATLAPRCSNPVGGASAFSWMTPASGGTKPKTPTTTAD